MNSRVFKYKKFAEFAKSEGISDEALCTALSEIENGLIDANLGGGVIKKRVARSNGSKSNGFRTIIFFKEGRNVFFFYGFIYGNLVIHFFIFVVQFINNTSGK